MCANDLRKVALDSAAAGIEPAISNRARGPRFESRCGKKSVFTKTTAIRSFGHGLHTDCSV